MATSTATSALEPFGLHQDVSINLVPPELYGCSDKASSSRASLLHPRFDPSPSSETARRGHVIFTIPANWKGAWTPESLDVFDLASVRAQADETSGMLAPSSASTNVDGYDMCLDLKPPTVSQRRHLLPLTLLCPTLLWTNAQHVPFLQLVSTECLPSMSRALTDP